MPTLAGSTVVSANAAGDIDAMSVIEMTAEAADLRSI
jgi:hypothetical protein